MALRVTTDELLTGNEKSEDGLSYSKAGVDIAYTDTIKREMAKHLETEDKRVLNRMGAFASLYDIHFPMMKEPVLVLKAEEPGSKQKLAMEYGYTESIVEKKDVIDGSAIQNNDVVLAVASNGLHTNGYSLVRMLMDRAPQTKLDKIDGMTFIEQIMKPHTPYYRAVKGLFGQNILHGMAHITGGGIEGNLGRVIPEGLTAEINLSKIHPLPVFKYIKKNGGVSDGEMLHTFNCGVGLNIVVGEKDAATVIRHISEYYDCYEIGRIREGEDKVKFVNRMEWI